jgi:hypothetical protein
MAAAASSSAFNMGNFASALDDIDQQIKSVSNAMALETTEEGKREYKGVFSHLLKRKQAIIKQQKAQAKSMATKQVKARQADALKKLEKLRTAKRSFTQSVGRHARAAAREAKKPQPNLIAMNLASVYQNMGQPRRSSQYGPVPFSRKTLKASRKHPYRSVTSNRSTSVNRSTQKKYNPYTEYLKEQEEEKKQNME